MVGLCMLATTCGDRRDAPPLAVMSFNIRYGRAADGDDHWQHRADLVVETIAAEDPDLLAVQEALRFQLDYLGAALPHYGEIGVGRDDGIEAGEYAAILYRRDRLEPVAQGTFWLSDTPDVPGSMSWGNRITRICTWARFADTRTGDEFTVYNAHFDHESQPSRLRSAELLVERMEAEGGTASTIVLGDFNAGEDNPARRILVATRAGPTTATTLPLIDTYRALHPASAGEGTFNGFSGDTSGARIDAILASSDWTVLEADIVHTERSGRYPSDHFPVTASLRHETGTR
jgi:endonuclease/exonuclease/phosphatase family metal-dependent hydrolase